MTTQYFYFSAAGSGSRADVTADNGVYVAENVTIGSTDYYCLTGTGFHLSFDIDGTVSGDIGGMDLTSTDDAVVRIGKSGLVESNLADGEAFYLDGFDGSIENRGEVRGHTGLEIAGDSNVLLFNYGSIDTRDKAVHAGAGATGTVEIVNYGRVEQAGQFSGSNIMSFEGKTQEVIMNLGIINGELSLGAGTDTYIGTGAKVMDGGFLSLLSALGYFPGKISSIVDAGAGDDQLIGGKYFDYFAGNTGNDSISGGGGDDILIGGGGVDTVAGGNGADEFAFAAASDSRGSKIDEIVDFSHKQHDLVDLSFDAKPKTADTDSFKFIGTKHFSGKPGELRYEFHGKETYLLGNTDHDKQAEFEVHFHGHINFVSGDFGGGLL